MPEFEGSLRSSGRVAIAVSRYHERVTARLLEGAMQICRQADVAEADVDVCWVDGAFELGVITAALAGSGRYQAIVALGAVIRGETPHFDYVAGETAAALARTATTTLIPIGFGLLTCDSIEQAMARAGGAAGNKGREAAMAALKTAHLLTQLRAREPDLVDDAGQ
jgi:6,7-dimethyl-8-ribityllumazine synthase